jgi:2-methylcitrate dehydratase
MHSIERLATLALDDQDAYRSPLALRQARLLLLDSIGCACAAIEADAVSAVIDVVHGMGGQPEATVIGSPGKTSVVNAVFANGALVRVLDLNDIMFTVRRGHLSVSGHRSDNIPVALAMAERCLSNGGAVLESIILNYELYGRLRDLIPDDAPWDAASVSGMVAAAMSGRFMNLDARRLAHGIALAAVRSPTPKIVRSGEISAAKSLANAFAAQAGVHSALLAASGVTGPLEVLDDRKAGLFQVFDPGRGLGRLAESFPIVPTILGAHVKSYPSIGTSQTAVKAALDLRAALKGRTDDIVRIETTMADVPAIRRQQADPARRKPKSREAADHSFAYLIAVALLDGELTHRQFANDRWCADAKVLGLMDCVSFEVSGELADRAPGSMPCRLRVELRSGEELSTECLFPPGHSFSERGLDHAVVEDKFVEVSRGVLTIAEAEIIRSDVLAIEEEGGLQRMMSRLSRINQPKLQQPADGGPRPA